MSVLSMVAQGLGKVTDTFNSVPLMLLIVGHCLACSSLVRGKYGDRFIINHLAAFAISFGGGSLSALLIQDPERVPPIWFSGDGIMLVWIVCWWAFYYSPFNLVMKLWDSLKPFETLSMAALATLRAGIIAQRIDYIMESHPGNIVTAIVMGIIGSSGGGMIVDVIDIAGGYSRGPSELAVPGYVLRSGTLFSVFHWLFVHRLALLTSRESLGVITLAFVGQAVVLSTLGINLDYTAHLAKLVHKIANIPQPLRKKPSAGHKPVTRSQTTAAQPESGDEVGRVGTPTSAAKTPRRRSGKQD